MSAPIVVAVDGSQPSLRAVDEAGALAAALGSPVVVFHLRHEPAGRLSTAHEPELEAEALVERARQGLERAGVADVRVRVDPGLAGQEAQAILDVATDTGARMVVMGSHGRSALGTLLVGSVAYRVIHLSQVPVLVVR